MHLTRVESLVTNLRVSYSINKRQADTQRHRIAERAASSRRLRDCLTTLRLRCVTKSVGRAPHLRAVANDRTSSNRLLAALPAPPVSDQRHRPTVSQLFNRLYALRSSRTRSWGIASDRLPSRPTMVSAAIIALMMASSVASTVAPKSVLI